MILFLPRVSHEPFLQQQAANPLYATYQAPNSQNTVAGEDSGAAEEPVVSLRSW